MGGLLVGVLGFAFIFKDQIISMFKGGETTLPPISLEDDMIDKAPGGNPINIPTAPKQLTLVEYKFGMDYYATRISEEVDKNAVVGINRTTKLNVKGNVLLHYKSDMKAIVDAQNMTLGTGATSLNEKSLRIFARVLVDVCDRMNIALKPEARARFKKQAAGKYALAMKGLIVS
jgi:hypothetical protein